MSLTAQLRYAPLPYIGAFAWHYWFVVSGHRWEVWQTKNAGGSSCIGHVHCDLKAPEDSVGGGPSRLAMTWEGDEAHRILEVLNRVETYPACQRYHYWPGPNSNTFVAWVLREARIDYALDPRGIGKNYLSARR
jgi:hypothetical protein